MVWKIILKVSTPLDLALVTCTFMNVLYKRQRVTKSLFIHIRPVIVQIPLLHLMRVFSFAVAILTKIKITANGAMPTSKNLFIARLANIVTLHV